MYAFIEGKVAEKGAGFLVLEAGGIGYLLNCSMTTMNAAPALGEMMKCQTYLSVKEDALELYGFASAEEKRMFLRLIAVSGIGPKMALGLLGTMGVQDLNMAILMEDASSLSRAPGIGKKTAQRIIMELRDKISQAEVSRLPVQTAGPSPAGTDPHSEAIEALIALGYSAVEARDAITRVRDKGDKTEELVRLALRAMAGA